MILAATVVVVTCIPVRSSGNEDRVGWVVAGVGAIGCHAVAIRVGNHAIVLATPFSTEGHRQWTRPQGGGLAVDGQARGVLGLMRVLERTGARIDVGQLFRGERDVATE